MAEPLSHILRERLPWSTFDRTECGKDPSEFASVFTLEEAITKVKGLGVQRAAFVMCMNCWHTTERHAGSRSDPLQALERVSPYGPYADRCRAEIRAVALLIEAHREEFEGAVEGILGTSNLAEKRTARRVRSAGLR